MLNDQAQYISLNRLNFSAISLFGFLIKAMEIRHGASPRIKNRIIPGIKKSEKGECSKMDKGKPPINFPDGEMIKNEPPPIALIPRNTSNETRIVRAVLVLIITYLKI